MIRPYQRRVSGVMALARIRFVDPRGLLYVLYPFILRRTLYRFSIRVQCDKSGIEKYF